MVRTLSFLINIILVVVIFALISNVKVYDLISEENCHKLEAINSDLMNHLNLRYTEEIECQRYTDYLLTEFGKLNARANELETQLHKDLSCLGDKKD